MRWLAPLLLLVASAASAASLEEVVELGLRRGRVPRRLRSELRAAGSIFGRTGARFRPKLTAILEERGKKELRATQRLADLTRATVTATDPAKDGDPSEFAFELFLPVFRTQALELKTAEYNWEATRRRNHQAMEDYKLALARQFYSLLRAQAQVDIRRRQLERWDGNLALAKFRADIGVRSKLDFWNTKVNRANAETALISAEVTRKNAQDQLANQLGVDYGEGPAAEEELAMVAFAAEVPAGWTRADLEAQEYARRLARESLAAARLARRPNVALTLGTSKTEGVSRDDQAALRYDFQFGRREEDHDWRVNKEALVQAEIAVEQQAADIEQEQRLVVRDLDAARRSAEVAEESLELAKLSYEASRLQFEAGRITQIELQRAQDNLTNAEQVLANFLIDYRIAGYRWRRAYGVVLFP